MGAADLLQHGRGAGFRLAVSRDLAALLQRCSGFGDLAYLLGDEVEGTPHREPASPGILAADLDVPRSTLRGWLDGAEPRHNDGEALLMRWCALTGKARAFAPLLRPGGKPISR